MPIFNDLNLDNWKESEIWTDSLWIISERDKSGKHNGFYHGNFVPQIPRQLILRYTKKGEVVLIHLLEVERLPMKLKLLAGILLALIYKKISLSKYNQKLIIKNIFLK